MRHIPAHFRHALATISIFGLLIGAGSAVAAEIPADDSFNSSKNLARLNCGARIERVTPGGRQLAVTTATDTNQSAAALLLDDDTLSCPLPEGETTFIVILPKTAVLDRFTFINENAAASGQLDIAVSNYRLAANDPKWTSVEGSKAFNDKRFFNISMVGVEAKYVKLSFHVAKEGRLAALSLYGQRTLQSFAARQDRVAQAAYAVSYASLVARPEDMLNFNFANLYARAEVAYVSSGPAVSAPRMIDDDVRTGYRFSGSDPHPTVIVRLAETEALHRVSTVYNSEAGHVDVYLLREVGSSPPDFTNLKPIASIVSSVGDGKVAVDFKPRDARYIALRWTRAKSSTPLEVAEISAFSVVPLSVFDIDLVPTEFADTGQHLAGEGGPDFSNSLGTLADPPTLPSVSP